MTRAFTAIAVLASLMTAGAPALARAQNEKLDSISSARSNDNRHRYKRGKPPATAPSQLVATMTEGVVTLKWSDVEGATGFLIYRSTNDVWSARPIAVTHRTYYRDRIRRGRTYGYKVAAINLWGVGPMSDPVTVTPLTAPAAPANLTATAGNGIVTLSWNPVAGATSYNVYRGTAPGAQSPTPIAKGITMWAFLDKGLTNGKKYFYKVTAVGSGGESARSNEVSATPVAPTVGAPVATASAGNATVTVSWGAITGAATYNVYRATIAGGQGNTPLATGITGTSFTDTGLINGTTYFYKVTAVGAGGESARSNEVSATPVAPALAAPVASATPGNTTVTVSWGAVPGATTYTIYRATTSGGQGNTPLVTGVTGTSFSNTGLTNGLTYFYQVMAVGGSAQSARSAEVSATPVGGTPSASPLLQSFRFLRQATWGPKPSDIAALTFTTPAERDQRFNAFITSQLNAPMSVYPDTLFDESLEVAQEHFMGLTVTGEDQLRQRMAWALHKIWVVSAVEVSNVRGIVTYHRLLLNNAFGNYRDLMRTITLNPAMGRYLNMLNNQSQAKTGFPANENYARELMQLFTLGLVQLNPDGTPTDSLNPVPTYNEDDVKALARMLTGWTFGDGNASTVPTGGGATNYGVPMEAVVTSGSAVPWHDVTAKTFLGENISAGGTARGELDQALDIIFNQPTLAPFVSKQLIQQLVTSNPSPAYVAAVTAVFNDNGAGIKGDLAAVVRAILMHPEALASTDANTMSGKLAEPVLYISSIMRALNATVSDTPSNTMRAEAMGQRVFYPPSVFSYFAPSFRVRGTSNGAGAPLFGPEFQGLTTVTALERANFVSDLLAGRFGTAVTFDNTPFTSRAGNAAALVDFCADTFMGGRISAAMRSAIITAVNASPAANLTDRANTAIYLTLTAAQAQVDR
jgi:uncharacterized protein (DUF1800 family)/fibronectin type 3 domain-containing protein